MAVADAAESKKDLTIEVPAEEVRAEFERTYQAFARQARVPGFRPGHVPMTIVKQRFGKDIKDEVLGALVPHALQHAIVDHKLRVIGSPSISEISLNDGEALRFKASVEVLPEFTLREYKGLKLTKRIVRIRDEDVDRVLATWRERAAQLVPVEDRPSQDGDFVSVNLRGKYVEPAEGEDLTSDDVVIEIGAEGVQPEFSENLRGVKAGDEREFRVAYPENFTSPGLAGKTLDFTVSVVAVREKEVPELDDEFAREFGEKETLDELRADIRADLERSAEARAEMQLRNLAGNKLIEDYDFPLPATLIERQTDELLQEFAYTLISQGVSPQTLRELDWEKHRAAARERAEQQVRTALIIERISEQEKIAVSREEIEAEIERMAESTGESVEAMTARLTKEDRLSSIESRLRYQKTLEFLVSNAEVTIEEVTETQEPEAESENGPEAESVSEDPESEAKDASEVESEVESEAESKDESGAKD